MVLIKQFSIWIHKPIQIVLDIQWQKWLVIKGPRKYCAKYEKRKKKDLTSSGDVFTMNGRGGRRRIKKKCHWQNGMSDSNLNKVVYALQAT